MPVYQYEGQHFDLPDGLSNEQALAKIKTHLGVSSKPEVSLGDGEGLLDKAVGLGQAAATTGTGLIGGAIGWVPAALQKINNPKDVDFEKQYAANMEAMTYEPSREKGREYAEQVGKFTNDILIPAATGVQGLPYANTLAPLLTGFARNVGKVSKAVPKVENLSPRESLRAEALKPKEEPIPETPVRRASPEELATQEALNRQAQAEGTPLPKEPVAPEHPGQLELPFTNDITERLAKQETEASPQLDLFEHKQPDAVSPEVLKQQQIEKAYAERPQTDERVSTRRAEEEAHVQQEEFLQKVEEKLRNEQAPGPLGSLQRQGWSHKQGGGVLFGEEGRKGIDSLVEEGLLKPVGDSNKGQIVYRALAKGEKETGPRAAGSWVTPNKDIAVNVYAKGDASRVVEDYIPAKDLYEAHPDGWIYAPKGTNVLSIKRTADTTFGDVLNGKQPMRVPKSLRGVLLISPTEGAKRDFIKGIKPLEEMMGEHTTVAHS
ncbi:MAG: hypothetical protein KGI54_11585, partial [Pseudomonadota bacterium]|nr:hypothetical protein [Pseudomonadota bacterium]